MNSFAMHLLDATQSRLFPDVTSFVASDRSGSFGIQKGHARLMASLEFGLARFRTESGDWQYLALPGALLYFDADMLTLSTRHFVIDADYRRINEVLRKELAAEEKELSGLKESLHHMEEEALRRLWQLGRRGPGLE